jgi:hypothetical protein
MTHSRHVGEGIARVRLENDSCRFLTCDAVSMAVECGSVVAAEACQSDAPALAHLHGQRGGGGDG